MTGALFDIVALKDHRPYLRLSLSWVETEPGVSKGETMTTLKDRPNTALLVVDVQNGVVGGTPKRDLVVANVGSLVERARRERVPVIWVQHSDDKETTLEAVLSGLRVGRLVVVGAQTDACIRSTLRGAFVRGYDATLSATPTRRRTRQHGGAAAGPGHRAHERVLDLPEGAGADGRDGEDEGCRLQGYVLRACAVREPHEKDRPHHRGLVHL